jgi:hypothetical protein
MSLEVCSYVEMRRVEKLGMNFCQANHELHPTLNLYKIVPEHKCTCLYITDVLSIIIIIKVLLALDIVSVLDSL